MSGFTDLSAAARKLLVAQNMIEQARRERAAALVRIHQDGCPKSEVSQRATAHLLKYGFAEDEVERLGLSPAAVRLLWRPGA
jgi:hypothetical protein